MMSEHTLSSMLLVHVLQFSIVIVLVGLVLVLTARRFPHAAFLLCMVALVKCLIPPVLPSPAGLFTMNSSTAWDARVPLMSTRSALEQKYGYRPGLSPEQASVGSLPSSVASDQGGDAGSAVGIRLRSGSAEFASSQRHSGRSLSLTAWTVMLWVTGTLVVLYFGLRRYRRMLRVVLAGAVPADDRVTVQVRSAADELGVTRVPQSLLSQQNHGPLLIGWRRPLLILPQQATEEWPVGRLRLIIIHELLHARRRDVIWGWLQFIVQAVWWFHPLVWWLGRRSSLLCERCVDEETLAVSNCSAAEYAQSILECLRLSSGPQPVPGAPGLAASRHTTERMRTLMNRYGKFDQRAGWRPWLPAVLCAAIAIPGAAWVSGQENTPAATSPPQQGASAAAVFGNQTADQVRAAINTALQSQDWKTAEDLLRKVVAVRPEDGRAAFLLGYVVHSSGRIEEAVELHRKAAEFPAVRSTALYNLACALAVQGNSEEAISTLEAAFKAGFVPTVDVAEDPDLASVADTEAFRELMARVEAERPESSRKGFDFWIGEWDVFGADGAQVGRNSITASDNGHVVIERWKAKGGGSGTSINYFDPADEQWKQTWVDGRGGVIQYSGTRTGDILKMTGTTTTPDGVTSLSRMTLTARANGSVHQLIEVSADNGKSWTKAFDGVYLRHTDEPMVR